jgi:hypothetical protein
MQQRGKHKARLFFYKRVAFGNEKWDYEIYKWFACHFPLTLWLALSPPITLSQKIHPLDGYKHYFRISL